jgi:drug/metabolite transporter (DMT)-like permease
MIPVLLILRPKLDLTVLLRPLLLPNLLFLGLVASALCYVMWGTAVNLIGVVRTSSYIYLVPLVTMVSAAVILHETITPLAGAGAVFILSGTYISENGLKLPKPSFTKDGAAAGK